MDLNAHGLQRTIPEAVRREIRQRCRFGCVVCGSIPYEYHHFDPPFTEAREHLPSGITLLCPTHHANVTRGLWSNVVVAGKDKAPFNKAGAPHFHLECRDPFATCFGSFLFAGSGPRITIEGTEILRVDLDKEEGLLLSLQLYDSEGHLTAAISRNHLQVLDPQWDLRMVGNVLQVRRAPGNLALELAFHPPNGLGVRSLRMVHKGWTIDTSASGFITITTPQGQTGGVYNGFWICEQLALDGGTQRAMNNKIIAGGPIDHLNSLAKAGRFQDIIAFFVNMANAFMRPR